MALKSSITRECVHYHSVLCPNASVSDYYPEQVRPELDTSAGACI